MQKRAYFCRSFPLLTWTRQKITRFFAAEAVLARRSQQKSPRPTVRSRAPCAAVRRRNTPPRTLRPPPFSQPPQREHDARVAQAYCYTTPPRRRGGAEFEFRLERLQASRRPLWRGSGIARWDVMSKGTASSSPISITMRQSDTLSLASRCWLGRPPIRAQELWAFAQCTFPIVTFVT